MSFGVVSLHLLTMFLLAVLAVFSFTRRDTKAAFELGLCAAAALIWSLGSFVEMAVLSFDAKLIWRNITQFGTFYSPPAVIAFGLAYVNTEPVLRRRLVAALYALATVPIALVWTDGIHHAMRISTSLSTELPGFETIVVTQTILGKAFVSLNYISALGGLALLLGYALRQSKAERRATLYAAAGMSFPWLFTLAKSVAGDQAFGGLPGSTAFSVGGFLILFGVLRVGLMGLGSIGRDRAFEVISEGILVYDTGLRLVDANPAAKALLSAAFAIPEDARLGEAGSRLRSAVGEREPSLLGGEELRLRVQPNGHPMHLSLKAFELTSGGRSVGYTGVLRDVTLETRRIDDLRLLAELDPLTGIYNKAAFETLVSEMLRRGARDGCLVLFDIDRFKRCNDTSGHLAGDSVLRGICALCKESLREGDVFGRVGGDEFGLFLAGAREKDALGLAERVRAVVAEACFDDDGRLKTTISLGVAAMRDGRSESFESMYRRADEALYRSKAAGRNTVSMADAR